MRCNNVVTIEFDKECCGVIKNSVSDFFTVAAEVCIEERARMLDIALQIHEGVVYYFKKRRGEQ